MMGAELLVTRRRPKSAGPLLSIPKSTTYAPCAFRQCLNGGFRSDVAITPAWVAGPHPRAADPCGRLDPAVGGVAVAPHREAALGGACERRFRIRNPAISRLQKWNRRRNFFSLSPAGNIGQRVRYSMGVDPWVSIHGCRSNRLFEPQRED